ncbi:hypothetical protein NQ318_015527 [Aromia moschata]|uniref:DUF4817 domain-containing protein n=1 Tax=Aromia moschata TaxID=1265417 RepID=A0AAV8XQF4_9CUCU|nr:hypothetical protein NQ318_015527 [Aromia moschata]
MHKITILQMIGYGDRTRTQAEVVRLFQEKYQLPRISQGTVNWSRENPHWMRELHTQNSEKVNIWAGIIGENIIGPFFIDGNLNGETYIAPLQNNVLNNVRRHFYLRLGCCQDAGGMHFEHLLH